MPLSAGKLKQDKSLLVTPERFAFCEAPAFLAEVGRRLCVIPSTFIIKLLPLVLHHDYRLYPEMAHFSLTCRKNT